MTVKRGDSAKMSEPPPELQEQTPRDRIVHATIQCIERFGVSGATVRRIAAAAGVNVAAINYYFGTKDRLLEAALAQTLEEAFPRALGELVESIANHGGNVIAGTRAFFRGYLPSAFRYPKVSVAHLRDALLQQDYSGPAVTSARDFVEDFAAVVSPAMPHATEREKHLAVIHVWASLFTLAMLPGLFQTPPESLSGEQMVAQLLATLFGARGH
jgi:AcrR family transcriptional regulator